MKPRRMRSLAPRTLPAAGAESARAVPAWLNERRVIFMGKPRSGRTFICPKRKGSDPVILEGLTPFFWPFLFGPANRLDDHVLHRHILCAGFHGADLVNDVLALDHLAENAIPGLERIVRLVEEVVVLQIDVELGGGAI